MYLVDTDVLSALRRPERHVSVTLWVSTQRNEDLHLSVVSVGEIERGIVKARRRDPFFASALEVWLERVLGLYGDRILPIDLAAARRWGTMSHAVGHGDADLFIAATALRHGLTVVTRNVRHFEPVGVPVLNPFDPP